MKLILLISLIMKTDRLCELDDIVEVCYVLNELNILLQEYMNIQNACTSLLLKGILY